MYVVLGESVPDGGNRDSDRGNDLLRPCCSSRHTLGSWGPSCQIWAADSAWSCPSINQPQREAVEGCFMIFYICSLFKKLRADLLQDGPRDGHMYTILDSYTCIHHQPTLALHTFMLGLDWIINSQIKMERIFLPPSTDTDWKPLLSTEPLYLLQWGVHVYQTWPTQCPISR